MDKGKLVLSELGLSTPMGLIGPLIIGTLCAILVFGIENPAIAITPGVDIETCNDFFDCYRCSSIDSTQEAYYYDIPGWPLRGRDPTSGDNSSYVKGSPSSPTVMWSLMKSSPPNGKPWGVGMSVDNIFRNGVFCPCDGALI